MFEDKCLKLLINNKYDIEILDKLNNILECDRLSLSQKPEEISNFIIKSKTNKYVAILFSNPNAGTKLNTLTIEQLKEYNLPIVKLGLILSAVEILIRKKNDNTNNNQSEFDIESLEKELLDKNENIFNKYSLKI